LPDPDGETLGDLSGLTLDQIERLVIEQAIERAKGNLPAARSLGVSPSTLYRKRDRWEFAIDTAA